MFFVAHNYKETESVSGTFPKAIIYNHTCIIDVSARVL